MPGVSLLRETKILKHFFTGETGPKILAEDLVDSMITKGDVTKHPIEDIWESFQLGPEHLIRRCDALLNGEIDPEHLQSIGVCVAASDNFE